MIGKYFFGTPRNTRFPDGLVLRSVRPEARIQTDAIPDTDFRRQDAGSGFHLPVRSKTLSMAEAAVHLGLPERRMKLLALLGTGPARTQAPDGKIAYRREDLELYLTALHEKADISGTEMMRRRAQAAASRQRALELGQIGSKTGFPDPDPFMMLATGADARQHACFLSSRSWRCSD